MDRRSKRKYHSRRKRIQLDDDKEETSPDKHQAASSSVDVDQSSKSESSGRPHQTAAPSETDKDETNKQPPLGSPARTGAASPEPNCAICLGKLENKSFTDSCFHQFCYVCLLEWSKVKAECPLCKQTFKSIIHNVRSYEDYDQYHIPRPEDRDPLGDLMAPGGRRFRYRTTVTDHRYYGSQALDDLRRQIQESVEELSLQRPSRRHFPVSNHRAWRTLRQAASSSFRRGIYTNGLKVQEPRSTRRRFREAAPEFFRDNAACTHRLVPWLNRELNALLVGREDHVAYVLDLIMGLIKRYNINSEEFHQHVYPLIGRHTRHFMHEFLMFAKSPYHMAAYDQHAVYEPSSEYVNNESDTETVHHSDGNESDVMIVSPSGQAQNDQRSRTAIDNAPARIQPMDTNLLPWESSIISMAQPSYSFFNPVIPSFTSLLSTGQSRTITSSLPSTSGWDSPISGPSWTIGGNSFDDVNEIDVVNVLNPINTQASASATSTLSSISSIQPLDLSNNTALNLGNHSVSSEDSNIYRNFLEGLNLTSATSSQAPSSDRPVEPTSKINPVVCTDSDSDSDAVMIVDYEKPWLDRSPIHLSTDNSSDCDLLITGTSNMGPDVRVKKQKKRRERLSVAEAINPFQETVSVEKHVKKRKHRSRSKSLPRQYRKRKSSQTSDKEDTSSSRSPLLLRLHVPQYKDKFSKHYRKELEKTKHRSDKKHRDSHRSDSHSSSRSKYRKRSLSSSSSDGEHVSFRSHKHKSRSGMEIMEYFKKSVKRKKSKKSKHRSRSPCDLAELYRHKKNKKNRERFGSKDRDKKNRHKHRHDRVLDKPLARDNSSKNTVMPDVAHLSIDQLCTSLDSFLPRHVDPLNKVSEVPDKQNTVGPRDSNTSLSAISKNRSLPKQINTTPISFRLEEGKNSRNVVQKESSDSKAKSSTDENLLGASNNLEFVEMLPSQASLFDKELESLSQLFPDFTETSDAFDPVKATFKKHPHGHKKSSKSKTSNDKIQRCVVNSSSERRRNVAETISNPTSLSISDTDDIQLNTITSCTDPETDEPFPNVSLGKESNEINEKLAVIDTSSNLNVAIPSTVLEIEQSDGELIDVDGQSEDSDVDVLKISEANLPSVLTNPAYKSSSSSVNVFENAHDFDNNKSNDNTNAHHKSDCNTDDDDTHLDVDGLSDSGSDTIQFGGVELLKSKAHSVEKEIDVTGISDSETITYLSETNDADNDSGSEIDVLAIPNEDIIIEPENFLTLRNEQSICRERAIRSSKTLFLESDSEGIDLDYQCEHLEETDLVPKHINVIDRSREQKASNSELNKSEIDEDTENTEPTIETLSAAVASLDPRSVIIPNNSDSFVSLSNNVNVSSDEEFEASVNLESCDSDDESETSLDQEDTDD